MLVKGITRQIFDKIKDYVTVFGDPAKFAVNINTAPKAVLSVVIMADATSGTLQIDKVAADIYADRIITSRNGVDGIPGTKDDASTADIPTALKFALQDDTQAANLTKDFTTKSAYFRIESTGTISKSRIEKRIVCVWHKEQSKESILKYYREY